MTSSSMPGAPVARRWRLQDARARLSELVHEARERGPQHVSVRRRNEMAIVSAEDFRRLSGNLMGRALIEACRASPDRSLELAPARHRLPVRDCITV
ncbi:MAG TPA: type II toxin-antitoxin system prevent-host-death family antitoxin [Rhizomicrobium sp.]|nr:type II toxin-antitoxin system prevent-host-death family antitoxin [Rhizomicrobium sp.]